MEFFADVEMFASEMHALRGVRYEYWSITDNGGV